MGLRGFVREVVAGRYYTRHPVELARYARARRTLSRHRTTESEPLLAALGFDAEEALAGADAWMPTFRRLAEEGGHYLGYSTGISLGAGLALYGVTRALRPEVIVETGSASGISTSFFSAALADNGHGRLYSLELPQEEAVRRFERYGVTHEPGRGPGWEIPAEVRDAVGDRLHLVLEDVVTALPRLLAEVGPVDVFLHDDLHTPDHMAWEFDLVWPRLRPGGVLLCDDAEAAWVRFARRHGGGAGLVNVNGTAGLRKAAGDVAHDR